jgi:hypothetical protein
MTLDIERLAREAGFIDRAAFNHEKELQRFAALIVEQCACIDFRAQIGLSHQDDFDVSKAIRALKGEK